jgi:hypothetical protein
MAPKRPSGTYKKGARKGVWKKKVAALNEETEKKLAQENAELREEIARLRRAHIQSTAAALNWRRVFLDVLQNLKKTELYEKYRDLKLSDTASSWEHWVKAYMDQNQSSHEIWKIAQQEDELEEDESSPESAASASPVNSDEQ